jgi:hypothetical protein
MLLYKTATKCLWRKPYQDILFIYRQIWLGPVHDILSNRKDSILLCHLWRKPYQDILFIYRQIWLGTVHDILSNRKVFILLCHYRRQQQNIYDENHTRTFYLFIDKFDWERYMTYYQSYFKSWGIRDLVVILFLCSNSLGLDNVQLWRGSYINIFNTYFCIHLLIIFVIFFYKCINVLKVEECVRMTWMPPLPAKVNRGITQETK